MKGNTKVVYKFTTNELNYLPNIFEHDMNGAVCAMLLNGILQHSLLKTVIILDLIYLQLGSDCYKILPEIRETRHASKHNYMLDKYYSKRL